MAKVIAVSRAAGTLFHIAAKETGNALLAWRLAAASGRADPWLSDTTQVTIPNGPSPPGDGLPPH